MEKYRIKEGCGAVYDIYRTRFIAGEVIELDPASAEKIMFKLEPLNPPPEKPEEPEPKVRMLIIKNLNGYDLINAVTGKAINPSPLTLEQAKAMAPDAEYEEPETVDPDPIQLVHKGGGRYVLVWEKTSEPVTEKLFSKQEGQKVLERIKAGELTIEDLTKGSENQRRRGDNEG